MAVPVDYPADLRADRPARSSRLWAVLTIILIKFLALIPHFFLLVFLGIAQWIVALVAQFVVAARGEYPPGMFRFVVGVLRWSTRVSAFALSLSDRYPPFSLEPDASHPIDVAVEPAAAAQPALRPVHGDRPAPLRRRHDRADRRRRARRRELRRVVDVGRTKRSGHRARGTGSAHCVSSPPSRTTSSCSSWASRCS